MQEKSSTSTVKPDALGNIEDAPYNTAQDIQSHLDSEQVENGVRLVTLTHAGEKWRLGSTTPNWRSFLSSLSKAPTAEALQELQSQGVWLSPAKKPPAISVICGGQGAIWPHMGRELYNTFPVARAAMDRIAAVAEWDVLSLMDETDTQKLMLTRWQSPYIFLVSYAQTCYLESLGFKPDVYSGHSLGELMALCMAGVYSPEDAWKIFDYRSVLVNDFENSGKHDTGMMAVYATYDKIEAVLREFPELLISNYNTTTQHILSGPRVVLAEARRNLRKQRIPAIILNVSMAFHHPHLRALREESIVRLLAFDIKSTQNPVISNVTGGLYPNDKEGIVEYIADLDENAVRWVDCVHTMWNDFNVRHFLEIGPADIVSGLTADIEPRARCLSTCRKGKEVETMRRTVAELYALGHISGPGNYVVPDDISMPLEAEPMAQVPQPKLEYDKNLPHVEEILSILMEETGLERSKLAVHMDLRHDLAIRSSRFPVIIHKLETVFDIQINFEDIMHVTTVGDLAQIVGNFCSLPEQAQEQAEENISVKQNVAEQLITVKADMQRFAHVYPIKLTAGPRAEFYARRNFSVYSDAPLQEQQCSTPLITAFMSLEALYAGAGLGFADLNCYGVDDVCFAQAVPCPGGVTREGQICVQAGEWMPSDPVLPCKAKLELHDITDNGRRVPSKTIIATCDMFLGKGEFDILPIWEESVQVLLDKQVIKEYLLPRKTFADEGHSGYNWPPACIALLQKLLVPVRKQCAITSIARVRHVPILPDLDVRVFYSLQKVPDGYEFNAQLYSANTIVLTVQAMHIADS